VPTLFANYVYDDDISPRL